jgi:hypothetical protein
VSEPILTPKGQLILAVCWLASILAGLLLFLGPMGTMLVLAIMLVAGWLLSPNP